MFTPADREIFANESLEKERLEKAKEKECANLAKIELKNKSTLEHKRNKFIINILLNNFEDYFDFKYNDKTFFLRKISERWEVKWNVTIKGPDQTSFALAALLHTDTMFKLMLIQQLKLLGWNIEVGFNGWKIDLTQTTKHKFSTFMKTFFQKVRKEKIPKQLCGPYRTLSSNGNEGLDQANHKNSLFVGFWPFG